MIIPIYGYTLATIIHNSRGVTAIVSSIYQVDCIVRLEINETATLITSIRFIWNNVAAYPYGMCRETGREKYQYSSRDLCVPLSPIDKTTRLDDSYICYYDRSTIELSVTFDECFRDRWEGMGWRKLPGHEIENRRFHGNYRAVLTRSYYGITYFRTLLNQRTGRFARFVYLLYVRRISFVNQCSSSSTRELSRTRNKYRDQFDCRASTIVTFFEIRDR